MTRSPKDREAFWYRIITGFFVAFMLVCLIGMVAATVILTN